MLKIGDKVKLLKDIIDHGDDCHPPGYFGQKGEILIIRKISENISLDFWPIYISHEEITDNSFGVMPDEIEKIEEITNDSTPN